MTRNKLKVSTKSSKSLENQEKVLNLLKEHPDGIYPKVISFYSKINQNTVKSILIRLKSKGIVTLKTGIRGLYVLVENTSHDSIFDWNFHNTTFSCLIPSYNGEAINETFEFGTIKYHFEIGKESKQATIRIITDTPINISSICVCFSYFSLKVKDYTSYLPELKEVSVSCIEFNQDYANLRLEGAKCITLTELLNLFKIYQKESGVRIEHRINTPIDAESIVSLLKNQTPYLSLIDTVKEIKRNQENSNKHMSRLYGIIKTILNKSPKQCPLKANVSNGFKSADQYIF
jgi:hypothetical protein